MGCGSSSLAGPAGNGNAPMTGKPSLRGLHKQMVNEGMHTIDMPSLTEGYGESVFKGAVADKYLKEVGLCAKDLDDYTWINDKAKPDQIAKALMAWALDRKATSFCHWFQPMASTFRHGDTGQVQLSMVEFNADGTPTFELKGKNILFGETDGSSYPNGGMRATHTAAAYLCIDPSSPVFLRGDAIFIPACLVSYDGKALDEKTPLLRAHQALSREGARLFKHMGYETAGMVNNIGLEQELFFIPREAFQRRLDLQFTGRTVMGRMPARGQELCDHYMAPINTQGHVLKCMAEIQHECFKLGIPLKTRHREVAPNQYEFAPLFGSVITQTDQNLVVMQICEEVAEKHGLACLLQEKPFQGVNGSGKHNNWSISTLEGVQLLNPADITKRSGNPEIFPVVMAAIVAAVSEYGDLMRLSIASPGNDFRLGAMEAPPSVISTYLGKQMTAYLTEFMNGNVSEYKPYTTPVNLGVDLLPIVHAPAEDRNRTSPFPYGGHRFEFRAVGSSQNVSMVNVVLDGATAKMFATISDRIEAGEKATEVAQDLLKKHFNAVFNGNGYDKEWPAQADALGISHIDSGVEAINKFVDAKNMEMFASQGIFSEEECVARRVVMLEAYVGTIEMEAGCMVDMINQYVIPSLKAGGMDALVGPIAAGAASVTEAVAAVHHTEDVFEGAKLCRVLRLETMIALRKLVDDAEGVCPANCWSLATYKELLFVDSGKFGTV
mmetsp:Transcript_40131/g.99328  ORF Transcript_40131/g.99328 Transcript_40131/m.99328 type:complete len:722 (+) Transcript_40131:67-2232(+)|eukprot:CAMPEP_0197592446 /NCGR_PEP_ID=MMETSP1326-20131121/15094_1 /TAXON_ID=1155430 /ORGANISM="Genus nov. species nov., Strain RCC2288" /LENGTH=721 /DNA_ID=CAMNT_0043158145 /DNA_START=66 /DNA_END=2231 /DNA_ORIENTATION=-